ncbi:MAG: hypothetical protein ACRD0D_03050 [Acidimicrobiales bacterium]
MDLEPDDGAPEPDADPVGAEARRITLDADAERRFATMLAVGSLAIALGGLMLVISLLLVYALLSPALDGALAGVIVLVVVLALVQAPLVLAFRIASRATGFLVAAGMARDSRPMRRAGAARAVVAATVAIEVGGVTVALLV